jgi:hypothetical protein
MPPTPSRPTRAHRLQALLDDLGPQIQLGDHPRYLQAEPSEGAQEPLPTGRTPGTLPHHATGLPEIDRLLGGGFPTDGLSEISGPTSSGRTSLLLALLARATTRGGAHVALVDRADAFDPPSAATAGVVLEQVLWVRAGKNLSALRCSERLLETEGFPLVVLDLAQDRDAEEAISDAAWLRLARLSASRQSALVLLSSERLAGPRAKVALEMQPAVAHFGGTPALLEELETRAVLVRHQSSPGRPMAWIRLGGKSNAA